MCPVCLATAAIVAGSATGTGGLTAFVTARILKRKPHPQEPTDTEEKNHGHN